MGFGLVDWHLFSHDLYSGLMSKKVSSITDILRALPVVQDAVRADIAKRIAAGEEIASMSDAELRKRSEAVLQDIRPVRTPKKSAA